MRAIFIGINGEGDDRRASFGDDPADPDFEAYLFKGRWVVGSGAQKISLVR